ncbi:MAG: hypothetical protein ACREDQ_07065, partial [Limisphaerales bacterium]
FSNWPDSGWTIATQLDWETWRPALARDASAGDLATKTPARRAVARASSAGYSDLDWGVISTSLDFDAGPSGTDSGADSTSGFAVAD